MNTLLLSCLIIEGLAILLLLSVLVWVMRAYRRLKEEVRALDEIVQSNTNDIAGLCSAALTVDNKIATVDSKITSVDSRIIETDEQIDDLAAKLAEVEQSNQASHHYIGDIRKVRSGASVNELMQNSGLSHDEAALLIRLHGSKTPP